MNKCIVVGNGPSIKNVPFDRLAYPSFGMNRLIPGFAPTYYVNLRREHAFRMEARRTDYKRDIEIIRDGVARCKERSFLWRGNIPLGLGDNKTTYMGTERINLWSDHWGHAFTFRAQTYCVAQIAVMLDFTELIMIGMDGNYKAFSGGKDPNHYSGDYWRGVNESMTEKKAAMLNSNHKELHQLIGRECAKRKVKVRYVNAEHWAR